MAGLIELLLIMGVQADAQPDAPYPGIHAAQVAELRPYASEPYFKYYCIAVNHGELARPSTLDALSFSTRARTDPPAGLLAELQDTRRRFVPASACEADSGGDIRHRASGAMPSLLVVIGQVEVMSA